MEKLRKIGLMLWNYKELMVLVVMLLILVYRVYGVLTYTVAADWTRPMPPKQQLPEEAEYRQEMGLPSNPPQRPSMDMPAVYVSFYERNPFWYHSGQAKQETDTAVTAEDLNIELLDIQEVGGKARARLRTSRTTRWYDANEQFEEFELTEINVEENRVVVFSERYDRPFTLEKK